jgi:periplasmic copper chaperone A
MNHPLARLLALLLLALPVMPSVADQAPRATEAWSRATPPGATVGAAYLVIEGGAHGDRLVGASSPRASMVHLHEVVDEGGMARMRSVDAVKIPAGGRVVLAPQGLHIMLMGLDAPLVAGQTFPLVLEFAESEDQTVLVTVREATGGPAGHH